MSYDKDNIVRAFCYYVYLVDKENQDNKKVIKMFIDVKLNNVEEQINWIKRCYKNWYSNENVDFNRRLEIERNEKLDPFLKVYWDVVDVVKSDDEFCLL